MGSQQREVVCLMKSEEGFAVLPIYECSSLDRPPSQQSCQLKACGAKWYHTDWSAVSSQEGHAYRTLKAIRPVGYIRCTHLSWLKLVAKLMY